MWQIDKLSALVDAFFCVDDGGQSAFPLLAPFLRGTTIFSEAAFAPFGAKADELRIAVDFYASDLASLDIVGACNDRFFNAESRLDPHYTRALSIADEYARTAPSDDDRFKVFVGTLLPMVIVHAVVCYLTGFILFVYAEEDSDSTYEIRMSRLRVAKQSCDQSRKLFERVTLHMSEIEQSARASSRGDVGSLVLHAALGLAHEKVFRMVEDLASGKSPFAYEDMLARLVPRLETCAGKAMLASQAIEGVLNGAKK